MYNRYIGMFYSIGTANDILLLIIIENHSNYIFMTTKTVRI